MARGFTLPGVEVARIAGPDCDFSASVGWAAREADDTSGALVRRADQNLYANKLT